MENIIHNPSMECMSRDERAALQGMRLRQTVKREYDHVPLYRERMKAAGVEPEDIKSIEDIRYLPFTEKNDLRDQYPFGLLAAPKRDIVRIHGSSGTTGKPIVAGYTQNDLEVWTEMVARCLAAAGCGDNDVVQVCYGYGLFTGGLGLHQGATKLGAMVIPTSSGNTQRQIMMMQDLGTTILCCTPSYAVYIGETVRDMGIKPSELRLKAGVFGAEPWSDEMRVKIEEYLGLRAYDIYGLTEICGPGVSFECVEQKWLHVNEDHVYPEIIDPVTEEPLPHGTPGELVFSTITKEGQPLLRFRTHDICTLYDEPCPCGRTTRRMGRITGRTDDMLIIRGVNVFPSQIESVLVGIHGVAPHYVLVVDRVNATDRLEIRVELTEDMFSDTVSQIERLANLIADQVKSVVGIQAKISLVPPRSIPRSEGKAKRIIDNRKI